MISLSSPGVTLAILAAAAIGVVSTWMLMRQPAPQPTFVLIESAPGESEKAFRVAEKTPLRGPSQNRPAVTVASTPRNSFPRAAAPSAVNMHHEPRDEPRPDAAPDEPAARPASVIYQGVNAPVVQQTNQVALNGGVIAAKPKDNPGSGGTIDDALSFALDAAEPHVKDGFTLREDYWGGDLAVKSTKAIVHQLFKGNEYWFWMGTDVKDATISVHIYDSEGIRADAEAWSKPHFAAARVRPAKSGSYYLIVEVEKSALERTRWALAYGFR